MNGECIDKTYSAQDSAERLSPVQGPDFRDIYMELGAYDPRADIWESELGEKPDGSVECKCLRVGEVRPEAVYYGGGECYYHAGDQEHCEEKDEYCEEAQDWYDEEEEVHDETEKQPSNKRKPLKGGKGAVGGSVEKDDKKKA